MAKEDPKPSDEVSAAVISGGDRAPVLSSEAVTKLAQRIQNDFDKAKAGGNKGGKQRRKEAEKVRKEKTQTRNEREPNSKSSGDKKQCHRNASAKSQSLYQPHFHPKGQFGPPIAATNKAKQSREAGDSKSQRSAGSGLSCSAPKQGNGPIVGSKPKPSSIFPKKADTGRIDKEALLKEIVELGGTQEDLNLLEGLDSDDDTDEVVIPDSTKPTKDIKKKDIEAFMKKIGLDARNVEDIDDEEVDDELEGQDEESPGSDEDDEAESPPEDADDSEDDVPVKKAPVPAPEITSKGGPKLLFPKRPDWHAEPLPALSPSSLPSPQTTQSLHERGKTLLQAENDLYGKTELVKSSERQFLSQIMQSGTLTDKISALTLICQESPLHTTKTLENLHGLAKKKSRSQAVQALGAIKDLFAQGVCLPPNRKLRFFAKQPNLGSKSTRDIHLVVWAYEDWLKNFYFDVLKTLEQLCTDQLVYARTNAVGYIYELLKEKPEQEANLLRVLVNKLGDTDKKISSKVSYLLLQLMTTHPAMKAIVIKSIESEVVFKPGNTTHAKYYAIITLNQIVLASAEHDVANKLLDIYFGIFSSVLYKENTMRSSQATGTNVTQLNSKGACIKFEDESTMAGKKMNKKARLRQKKTEEQTQFEEEVNAKLVSAVLTGVNRSFPFSKVDDKVFSQHMDTLFRITHSGNFNTSIQALMLIFQVSNSKQAVSDRFYRTLYESLFDQRLISSSKQTMYLNLLFRALKADMSVKRVKAFIKRILQTATLHQPSFICGVLYLLSELESAMPSLRTLITDPEPDADDEEVFRDVPDEGEGVPQQPEESPETPPKQPTLKSYDGRKRDPLHADADRSCLWELLPFLTHFHPTVTLFAQHLLDKKPMPSKPDLGMHTLTHFLDRFVYRNPKSAAAGHTRGASIMQPLAGGRGDSGMVLSTRGNIGGAPVNTEAFWKKKVEDIKPEEVFFHRYFSLTKRTPKCKRETQDSDEDEEEEEEQDGEIWKALVDSRPDLEGANDDDGSVDFDDDENLMDMSDDDDDDDDHLEIVDGDEVAWDTDESIESHEVDEGEGKKSTSAALLEAQISSASAKRQRMLQTDPDSEDNSKPKKNKKRKLKGLPTFASAEDYADMLSD